MLSKTKLLAEIEKFPDEFSIEELVERIIFIEKVSLGDKQSDAGDVVSEAEMDYEIKKWFE